MCVDPLLPFGDHVVKSEYRFWLFAFRCTFVNAVKEV
jgi:hypothetical protein